MSACVDNGIVRGRRGRIWAAGLGLGWCLAGLGAPGQEVPRNKVLIIGIDGTMPTALAVADTPHLDALIAKGAFSNRVVRIR